MTSRHPFGSLVSVRRLTSLELRTFLFFAGVLLLLSLLHFCRALWWDPFSEAGPSHDERAIAIAIVMLAACGGVLLGAWYSWNCEFRCYELGIVRTSPLGSKQLLFDEVESISFQRRDEYDAQGKFKLTRYFLGLYPGLASGNHQPLCLSTTRTSLEDMRVEQIEQHVTRLIASKMSEEIKSKGHVDWTHHLRINNDGVECLEGNSWKLMKWNQLAPPRIDGEYFYLDVLGNPSPLQVVKLSAPNLFPGLLIVAANLTERTESLRPSALDGGFSLN